MSEEQKQPYNDQSEQAKQLVERQKAELKQKGYYTLENGTKSTDPENKHLMKVPKKDKPAKSNKKSGKLALDDDEEDEEEKFVHPPPKRAASAWVYFNSEFCKKFVEGGGDRKDAFTKAGEAWAGMSEEAKKPYVDKQDEARALVEKQK